MAVLERSLRLVRPIAMRCRAWLLALGLASLTGCGGAVASGAAADPEDLSRVSFRPAPDVQMLAIEEGVLGGDPATGCLWFERFGERVPLVVEHDGAYADFDTQPVVVRDDDEVWAELGQYVRLGGGHVGIAEAVPECSDGGAPFVTYMIRVSASAASPE